MIVDCTADFKRGNEMALRIKQRRIDELKPYARNARIHTKEQIQQIAKSIELFGMNVPVLVDSEGGVLAGHGRLEALHMLGEETVPTIELGHLSDEQQRAFILADNKTAENAYWDRLMLSEELNLIGDIDMLEVGFSDKEFQGMFGDQNDSAKSAPIGDDRFLLLIDCGNEAEQFKLFDELNERGLEVTVMT